MNSAIYQGTIRHRRFSPVVHEFSYRMFLLYLDLDEIGDVFEGSRLFAANRRALAEFRRSDHLGDPGVPLKQAVTELVFERTGYRPDGPIRLLTHLRYFGYVFNPVSFYYCFDQSGENIECVVAEVNNTPWGEQHCYVLRNKQADSHPVLRFSADKAMHVSPFMPMNMKYDWRIGKPGEKLNLHMRNLSGPDRVFDATLMLSRKALTRSSLRRSLAAFPFLTTRIIFAIHWQALRLWLKGTPFYAHPALEANLEVEENTSR